MIKEYLKNTCKTQINRYRNMNKSRTKNKIEDIGLYYCTKCKKVWEYRKRYGMYAKISPPIVLKYGHIPSYGKERIICPECE